LDFKGNPVRVIMKDGEPWWLLKEVCDILGLHSFKVNQRLMDKEKSYILRKYLGLKPGKDMIIVNESGLYRTIFRSDKPIATTFQNWVFDEVLPSIRKTGGYAVKPDVSRFSRREIAMMVIEAEDKIDAWNPNTLRMH
jgi:prophage antirepressor-like protein